MMHLIMHVHYMHSYNVHLNMFRVATWTITYQPEQFVTYEYSLYLYSHRCYDVFALGI